VRNVGIEVSVVVGGAAYDGGGADNDSEKQEDLHLIKKKESLICNSDKTVLLCKYYDRWWQTFSFLPLNAYNKSGTYFVNLMIVNGK
jgi:hypothetical protein